MLPDQEDIDEALPENEALPEDKYDRGEIGGRRRHHQGRQYGSIGIINLRIRSGIRNPRSENRHQKPWSGNPNINEEYAETENEEDEEDSDTEITEDTPSRATLETTGVTLEHDIPQATYNTK